MKIQETITNKFIRFDYRKENFDFVVYVDFNGNVEVSKFGGNCKEIKAEIDEKERKKWIERRDAILGKLLKTKKLYEKIDDLQCQLNKAIEEFTADLDIENSVDESLIYSAQDVRIDYSFLEREAFQIPFSVLEEYEKNTLKPVL